MFTHLLSIIIYYCAILSIFAIINSSFCERFIVKLNNREKVEPRRETWYDICVHKTHTEVIAMALTKKEYHTYTYF